MAPEDHGRAGNGQAMTLRQLLARLGEKGLFQEGDAGLAQVAGHLEKEEAEERTPYYIRALVAIGAWVAAGFFILFLGMSGLISDDAGPLIGWGLTFIAGATVMRHFSTHVFPIQLALALSVTGHTLALAGVCEPVREFWPAPLAAAVLCAVLYPLYRDSVHRFLGTLLVAGTFAAWLLSEEQLHHGLHVLVLAEAVGAGVLFTHPRMRPSFRPLAYGLVVSLCLTLTLMVVLATAPHTDLLTPWWPSSVVLALGLIWLYGWMAGGHEKLLREPLVIAVVATLLFTASSPGILAALALVVLGYARDDRALLGLGLVFLPTFITFYYYSLDVELIVKSGVLVGSGAVLLLARFYLGTRPWAREAVYRAEGAEEAK
jgi:hypothetical protein